MQKDLIQLTEYAASNFTVNTVRGPLDWASYLATYRTRLLKHGRKAEIRTERGEIALFVNNVAV